MSHSQVFATIKIGGAAKFVKVPPTDIFTNKAPKVMYFNLFEIPCENSLSLKISAASVIAAGSVISEPKSGTKHITTK